MIPKLPPSHSQLEDAALLLRLQQLGIRVNSDRTIDPNSLRNIEGGAARLEQLLSGSGVLTLERAAQLRRAEAAVGGARADPTAESAATDATRALKLQVKGLRETLQRLAGAPEPTKSDLDKLSVQARMVGGAMTALGLHLGKADPPAVSELVAELRDLPKAAQNVLVGLSEHRLAWLDDPERSKEIIASLRASAEVLTPVQQSAVLATEPAWKSYGALQMETELRAWDFAHSVRFPLPGQLPTPQEAQATTAWATERAKAKQEMIVRTIDRLERETGLMRSTIATGIATFYSHAAEGIESRQLLDVLRYFEQELTAPQQLSGSAKKPTTFAEAQLLYGLLSVEPGGAALLGWPSGGATGPPRTP